MLKSAPLLLSKFNDFSQAIKSHLRDKFDRYLLLTFCLIFFILVAFYYSSVADFLSEKTSLVSETNLVRAQLVGVKKKLGSFKSQLLDLKSEDQYKINQGLKEDIKSIHDTFLNASKSYESLIDLKSKKVDTSKLDSIYAAALKFLADQNYASASSNLNLLDQKIKEENDKLVASFKIPENVPASNTPPASGYSQQRVSVESGSFLVSIISADLNSTRVIVDTASDSDCSNDCPVLSLGEYVSRNGAFAGINGSFFCPAAYPSCAGKTNSFDTLLMNKNKHYFNSDNNVYSTVPAVIFQGNSIRFISRSLEWGRDTSPDSVIANYPLYVVGSQNQFGGNGDPKIDNKGTRAFVADKGSIVYIGIIYNASGSDAAKVLVTLGMNNALGLDQGGSTALWFGGYKAGPGRAIPNAILFVKR